MSRYQETQNASDQTAASAKSSHAQQPSLCQCSSPNCSRQSCLNASDRSFQSLEKSAPKKIETIVEEGGPDELYEVIHERESFEEDEAEEEEDEGEGDYEKDDDFAKANALTPESDPDYECIVVSEVIPPAEKRSVENLNDWRSSCLCNFKQAQESLLDKYIKHYSETWQFSRHLQKLGNATCTCDMHDTSNKGTVVRDFCPSYHAARELRRCPPKKRTCAMDRRLDSSPIDFLDKSIEQFCKMAKGRITKKDNDCVIINCSLSSQSDDSQETLCPCEPPPSRKEKSPKAYKTIQPCPVFRAMQKSNEYPKARSSDQKVRAKKSKRRGTNTKTRRGSLVKFGNTDETTNRKRASRKSREKLQRRKTPGALLRPIGIVTRGTQMTRELECQCTPEDENVWEDVEEDADDCDDDDDDDNCNDDNCENLVDALMDDAKKCPCSCDCGCEDVDELEEKQPATDTKGSQTNKKKSKKKTIYIKICNGFHNAPPPPKPECQCACAPPQNTCKIQETQSERAKPTFAKCLNDKSKILSQKCCKERPICRKSLPKVCLKKLSTSLNKCRELLAKEQANLKSMRASPAQLSRCLQDDRTRLACCQSSRQSQHNSLQPCLRPCGPQPARTRSVESNTPFCNRSCCAKYAGRDGHRTKATQSVDECTCVAKKDNKQVACKPQQSDNYTETCRCVGRHGPYDYGLWSGTDLKTACSLGDLESPFSLDSNFHPCMPRLRANTSDTCTRDNCYKENYTNPCCSNQMSSRASCSNNWCRWAHVNPRFIRMNCPGPRYCIAYNHQIQYQSSFYPNTAVQVDSMELIKNEPPTKLNADSQQGADAAIQASISAKLASIQLMSDEKSMRGDKYEPPEKDHSTRSVKSERNQQNVSDTSSDSTDTIPTPPSIISRTKKDPNASSNHSKKNKLSATETAEEEIAEDNFVVDSPPKPLPVPSRPRESKRVSMKYEFPIYPPAGAQSGTDSIEERIRILRKNLEARHGSESNSNRSEMTMQSFAKETPSGKNSIDEQEMTSHLLSRRLTTARVIQK